MQPGGGAHAAAQVAAADIGHPGSDAATAQQPGTCRGLPVAHYDLGDQIAADLAAAEAADKRKLAQPPKRCAAPRVFCSTVRSLSPSSA